MFAVLTRPASEPSCDTVGSRARVKGFERPVRALLLCAVLAFQLWIVVVLLDNELEHSTLSPLGCVVLVALATMPFRAVCRTALGCFSRCDDAAARRHPAASDGTRSRALLDDTANATTTSPSAPAAILQPRAAVLCVLIGGGTLYRAVARLAHHTPLGGPYLAKVVVDYICSLIIGIGVLEPLELLLLYRCCAPCCPKCCFNDDELEAPRSDGGETDQTEAGRGHVTEGAAVHPADVGVVATEPHATRVDR